MSETVLRCHYDGLEAENSELCKKVEQQRGECLMLADVLRDAYEVVKTIEGEDSDECEKLSDLRMSIEYALAAYDDRRVKTAI